MSAPTAPLAEEVPQQELNLTVDPDREVLTSTSEPAESPAEQSVFQAIPKGSRGASAAVCTVKSSKMKKDSF